MGRGLGSFCLRLTPFPRAPSVSNLRTVAEAVIYVLLTPPHVQVSLALAVCPLEGSQPAQAESGEALKGGESVPASSKPCAFCRLETSR